MAPFKPEKFTISRATGRNTSTPTRLPTLAEVEFTGERGEVISAAIPKDGRHVPTLTRVLVESREPVLFDECAICGSPDATSKEHVPPHKLGGGYVTRTCPDCNNTFGGKYENAARQWWEYEFGEFALVHPKLRGTRYLKNVLLRMTDEGEPVVMLDLPADGGYKDAFASGEAFGFDSSAPDPALWRLAILKAGYIGACVLAGGPIQSEEADRVRQLLIAARDAPKKSPPPLNVEFDVARIDREAVPGLIQFVAVSAADAEDEWKFGVLLANVLYVSWVFGSAIQCTDTETGEAATIPL